MGTGSTRAGLRAESKRRSARAYNESIAGMHGGTLMLQPGLMMERPLLISDIIEHAAAQFATTQIVSRETHGPVFRYSFAACAARARRLAHALRHLGLAGGSAAGSIAWNHPRPLDGYYPVSGSGMVRSSCNPRLPPEPLIYTL